MSFELSHPLVFKGFTPSLQTSNEQVIFKANERGKFPVLFTGRLNRSASATFEHLVRGTQILPEGSDSGPLHGGNVLDTRTINFKVRIFTPGGTEFTATEITRADLQKFRNQRGSPSGPWSYTVTGESFEHIPFDEEESVTEPRISKGRLRISIGETIRSESAPPLVNNVPVIPTLRSFQFDLYRVGTFVAEISPPKASAQWRGTMRLIDPDGVAVARTQRPKLTFDVGLPTLNKSRDAAGKVRKWTLEVSPQGGVVVGSPRLSATVIGRGRITLDTIRKRIDALLGKRGKFINIFGENKGDDFLVRLKITDLVSAETIDMHGLLDNLERDIGLGATPGEIQTNTIYTLLRKPRKFTVSVSLPVPLFDDPTIASIDLKVDVNTLKIGTIDVAFGPGDMLGASVPALKLTVAVSGAVKIRFGDSFTLADVKVRGGKFAMEVGIKLSADGTPQIVTAVPNSPFDADLRDEVIAELLLAFPLLAPVLANKVESKERDINDDFVEAAQSLFSDPTLAPTILMTIFGAHLTYLPFRIEGDEIVFDHIAPVEPEPKPTPGYRGAIGRSFTQLTPNAVTFIPPLLGDTWRADNLSSKIDHIVVVMMENRSYDHVLGYRAQFPFIDGGNGLTAEMIKAIEKADGGPFKVRKLSTAEFDANDIGLRTRLPVKVGHELDDVEQQLSIRTLGPGNRTINSPKAKALVGDFATGVLGPGDRTINSPKGFVDNFKPKLKQAPNEQPHGVVPDDVLGFYDEQDLPIFAHLAKHYAYCDRFYCSHPGPTLPNRMYSLTGNVQHDRYGFPILENNNSDNFLLSREPTIYDIMVRKGLSFRVYESEPSVTMLRMFARYATDNTNIVPIAQLEADMAPGGRGLPDFTAIEPQMHAHPQDDDHPDADMHRGQQFVKRVYDALTSNATLWERTLLIITYDEHGGLYDHVVPPIADIYNVPGGPLVLDSAGGGSSPSSPAPPALLAIPYGVRVPTFVVSPWTARGKGPSITLDHCSILKTVLARFLGAEKPFLSDRVSASLSFEAFLTEAEPRMDVPRSPSLRPLPLDARKTAPSPTTRIITKPLSRKEMREGPVDYHELSGRWARQLGR